MTADEVKALENGARIIDAMTGEELIFSKWTKPYAECYDSRGTAIWLIPNRVLLK